MTGEKPSMRRIGIYVEQETLDSVSYTHLTLPTIA